MAALAAIYSSVRLFFGERFHSRLNFFKTINAKNRCFQLEPVCNGFWNSIHLQLVLSESNLCMTILLRPMVKLQAAVEILSKPPKLILAHTVENQTGATLSASFQFVTPLNIRPPLAGKLQARLIKTAKFTTLPFERKKQSAPGKLATGNTPRVTVLHLSALCALTMAKAVAVEIRKNLLGIKSAGISAKSKIKMGGCQELKGLPARISPFTVTPKFKKRSNGMS